MNIPDCYKDPRFNQAVDKKTGYRTRSMLCLPIFPSSDDMDQDRQTLGVLQVINKMDSIAFGAADESVLSNLLGLIGPLIAKSPFFSAMIPTPQKRSGPKTPRTPRSRSTTPRTPTRDKSGSFGTSSLSTSLKKIPEK